LLVIKHWV